LAPPRRRPDVVARDRSVLEDWGRFYGASEVWRPHVETLPVALRHPGQVTGTAGRLRSGNHVAILSAFGRHDRHESISAS